MKSWGPIVVATNHLSVGEYILFSDDNDLAGVGGGGVLSFAFPYLSLKSVHLLTPPAQDTTD